MTHRGPHAGTQTAREDAVRSYHLAQLEAAHNTAARELGGAARWYATMIEYLGPDTTTWHRETRETAEALPADLRHAVEAGARGGRGAEPPSYPDYGHLRFSADQDGAKSTSEWSALAASPVSAAQVRRSREQLRPWPSRHDEWLHELALRSAVESATGRPIIDREGRIDPCRRAGQAQQHVEDDSVRRFVTYTCDHRDRCPHCARVYGATQGAELASLIEAAAERGGVQLPATSRSSFAPLAWRLVVTLPAEVSAYLGRLADSREAADRQELKDELKRMMDVVRGVAAQVVMGDDAQRQPGEKVTTWRKRMQELGAAVNLHWWSSRTPTRGYHWHAHVIIPNARRSGGKWRDVGTLSQERLAGVREAAGRLLHETWPELVAPGRGNVDLGWMGNDQAGRTRLRHRARYDARHPYADVLKQSRRNPEELYADEELEALATLAVRIERLQMLKTRRYVGWLAPSQRKKRGLEADDDDEPTPEWEPVPDNTNGGRFIVGITEEGVRVWHRDEWGEGRVEVIEGRDVKSGAERGERRWRYNPNRGNDANDTAAKGISA